MATFQLTNLLTNPSFENTGWAANASCSIAYATNPVHSGSYSLQVNSTSSSESLVVTSDTIPLVNGHIYYCGVYFYQASAVCSMMQVYWPIAEPTWGNSYVDSTKLGQWQRLGWRVTRSNWSSSNYQFRFDFEGMAANTTAYIDDAVLIDLTACFGSGNEPSLEWCNSNIPYFAGSQNINYDAPIAYDLTMTTPTSLRTGDILNCPYSGGYKAITLPKGTYKFECWGARGGSTPGSTFGGLGGYVSGILNISTQSTYYLFTGGTGADSPSTGADGSSGVGGAGGYNGGGTGGGSRGPGGGGCSAIGTSSTMSQSTSLLVAGGGGGCVNSSYTASANARLYQTSNVTTNHIGGNGATGYSGCYPYDTCGGGGGYYGGTSITTDDSTHAYGGVNYVGGMFVSPSSLAGESVSSRPSANHGYIRITVIKVGIPVYVKTDNTTITQAQRAYIKSNNAWVELSDSQLPTYFTNNKPYRTIMIK